MKKNKWANVRNEILGDVKLDGWLALPFASFKMMNKLFTLFSKNTLSEWERARKREKCQRRLMPTTTTMQSTCDKDTHKTFEQCVELFFRMDEYTFFDAVQKKNYDSANHLRLSQSFSSTSTPSLMLSFHFMVRYFSVCNCNFVMRNQINVIFSFLLFSSFLLKR